MNRAALGRAVNREGLCLEPNKTGVLREVKRYGFLEMSRTALGRAVN